MSNLPINNPLPWMTSEYLTQCEKHTDFWLFITLHPQRTPDDGLMTIEYRNILLKRYAALKWAKENGKEYLL